MKLSERIDKAAQAAQEKFWESIAADFPEARRSARGYLTTCRKES
jgi:hypothetical protein